MLLKKLFAFNLVFALTAIVFFYFKFSLLPVSIPVHLFFITYGMLFIVSICLLIIRHLGKTTSRIFITTIIIISYIYLVCMYILYYISFDNWGHAITLDILLVYVKEIKYLIETLPIHKPILATLILGPNIIIILSVLVHSKKLVQSFRTFYNHFFHQFKTIKLLIIILIIILPIGFVQSGEFRDALGRGQQVREDPFVSLLFYKAHREKITAIGGDNIISKKNYPTNLSFEKKNVILIICDALRSDHLCLFGYNRNTSPFLDSLSKRPDCIHFDHFYSTSSRTVLGVSNILSSTYGLAYNNFFLHDLLHSQGYQINFILSGDNANFYGLKKHFGKNIDNYYDGLDSSKEKANNTSINDDNKVILDKLNTYPDFDGTPCMFYLHFLSAHQIGKKDPRFSCYFPDKIENLSSANSQILINEYDNRVRQLDSYLDSTFSILEKKKYLDNSIIIITSDHGQALLENGRYWHGKSTYLSETNIPLLLIDTDNNSIKTKETPALANQLDIAPTIVNMLNIPIPETWQGHSVFDATNMRAIYQNEREFYSMIWSEDKFIYQFVFNKKTKKIELFDITGNNCSDNLIKTIGTSKADSLQNCILNFFGLQI